MLKDVQGHPLATQQGPYRAFQFEQNGPYFHGLAVFDLRQRPYFLREKQKGAESDINTCHHKRFLGADLSPPAEVRRNENLSRYVAGAKILLESSPEPVIQHGGGEHGDASLSPRIYLNYRE